MVAVNTHEAKTHLSALLAKVEEKGETVVICRNGKPVAELRRPETPVIDPLARHPNLKPVRMVRGFDPVAPLSLDDWPETLR